MNGTLHLSTGTSLPLFELRARQQFTTAGEQDGSLVAALDRETVEDLEKAYFQCRSSAGWSDRVFGGNARRWESHVAQALHRRGITSFWVVDCFGRRTIEVKI